MADNDRLIAVEERLLFQQRQIEQLNDAALQQRRDLDLLSRQVDQLRGVLQQLLAQGAGDPLPHEKPPHY